MRARHTNLRKQYQWPNGRRPFRPIDVFSRSPVTVRVLLPQILSHRGPRHDVFSSLHDFVVSFWLAKNVLKSPEPNRRVLAVQQPFNSLVLLLNFNSGCQLVNLRYEATSVPG